MNNLTLLGSFPLTILENSSQNTFSNVLDLFSFSFENRSFFDITTTSHNGVTFSLKGTNLTSEKRIFGMQVYINKLNALNYNLRNTPILVMCTYHFNTASEISEQPTLIEYSGLSHSGFNTYTVAPNEKYICAATYGIGSNNYAYGVGGILFPHNNVYSWSGGSNVSTVNPIFVSNFPITTDPYCSLTITDISFYIYNPPITNYSTDDVKKEISNLNTLYLPGELIENQSQPTRFTKTGNLLIQNDFIEGMPTAAYKDHFESFGLIEY